MHAGFGLVNYKLTSTWAEHCPAYFLAINLEKKKVIISIRGTAQVEDVITDLTALPTVSLSAHSQLATYIRQSLLLPGGISYNRARWALSYRRNALSNPV